MINIVKTTVNIYIYTCIYIYIFIFILLILILCAHAQFRNLPNKDMLYNEGQLDRTMCVACSMECTNVYIYIYICIPYIIYKQPSIFGSWECHAKLCQEIAELQGDQTQANGARPRSSLPVRVMLKKSKHCKQDRHETILGQSTKD